MDIITFDIAALPERLRGDARFTLFWGLVDQAKKADEALEDYSKRSGKWDDNIQRAEDELERVTLLAEQLVKGTQLNPAYEKFFGAGSVAEREKIKSL